MKSDAEGVENLPRRNHAPQVGVTTNISSVCPHSACVRKAGRMKKQTKTKITTSNKIQANAEVAAKTSKSEEQNNATNTGTAPSNGPYLGCKALDKEIIEFCRRSEKRQKNSFGMSYDQGDDIRKMIALIEGKKYAHLKRRPNNSDPYGVLAGHPENILGMKQMRRYVLFADTVDAIRAAKYEAPILGLTYYVEAARLKSVESIIETLNQVVKDDLSVRELIGIVDQIMPPKKKASGGDEESRKPGGAGNNSQEPSDWKKSLEEFVGHALAQLAPIAKDMTDQNAKLDEETAKSLKQLQAKIQDILRKGE